MKNICILLTSLFLFSFLANCNSTTHIEKKNFSYLKTSDGQPIAYQKTINRGIYLFGIYKIYHNAKLEQTMNDFAKEAKKRKAKKIDVIQKDETSWYIVFPPFSFIITPVTSEVFGAIYK